MADRKPIKINFVKGAVKSMGKAGFIKEFKDVYPDNDMSEEWDKLFPVPVADKKDK